jgi:hypothetical protein
VVYGVYGRCDAERTPDGFAGVVHICDYTTLRHAVRLVEYLVGPWEAESSRNRLLDKQPRATPPAPPC